MHVLVSSIGILNREFAVLPRSNSSAAIPDDATAKALLVLPVDLLFAEIVLLTNVFPVSPGPSRKKAWLQRLQLLYCKL